MITEKNKEEIKKKPNLKYQRDKDREKVKGIFRFFECPGSELSFVYKAYKEDDVEDDVEKFTLIDGEIYTLPLGVAKHLIKVDAIQCILILKMKQVKYLHV